MERYKKFLESKVVVSENFGTEIDQSKLSKILLPHQKTIIPWAISGGRRAIFANFGLGKSMMQLEIARQVIEITGKPFLICMPLAVIGEFRRDNRILNTGLEIEYITETTAVDELKIYVTNYARVRMGSIDPQLFGGVSFDEASILRNLKTQTTNYIISYFKAIPYRFVATATPTPNDFIEILNYADYLGVIDRSHALAQPLDAKILTPNGWVNMGDIKVGDHVFSNDGEITKVIGVYPQGEKEIYKVSFSDGTWTECTGDHLWFTKTQTDRHCEKQNKNRNNGISSKKYGSAKTTMEILSTLRHGKRGDLNHSIPISKEIIFSHKKVEINPYLLGCLLGDGYLRKTSIHYTSNDAEVVEEIRNIINKEYQNLILYKSTHKRKDGTPNYDYNFTTGRGSSQNKLLSDLRQYKLLGKKSWEKFIPKEYLFNDVDTRISILQGIMDTDGTVMKDGSQILTTTSRWLRDDVKFIAQSLGGTVRIREVYGRKPNGQKGRIQYKISLNIPQKYCPFRYERKKRRIKIRTKHYPNRIITNIERVSKKEAQCIMVDSESHLYLTNDCIVTHNTRFFQRDSTKAGHLTLYENKKDEFWKWVATWAVFLNKPSDLGYDDTGYNLPGLNFIEKEVSNIKSGGVIDKDGNLVMFRNTSKSLVEVSREKSESIEIRVAKTIEILKENPGKKFILWHHREAERHALEKALKGENYTSVYGSQPFKEKEHRLIDFSEGKYDYLISKPQIAGSGCNFQHICNNMIFVGIDYKFNDFIQAVHRIFRFRQKYECNVYAIYTNNEYEVLKVLKHKWAKHAELQEEMINIVREYGLNSDKIKTDMKRQLFSNRRSAKILDAEVYNEDTVKIHEEMEGNSTDMILTSIPFGDHYEYSDNYNDMGHNHGNDEFFKQMDFLTPNLLRTLRPGRIAAVHVKDRIRYSYQNGAGFTTISDFSGKTVAHFEKHGFYLVGKITVTTDVVRENNQTYRLTWGEQRKDATKMGVGLPEYILLFRKKPTDTSNAYADDPVIKDIDDYLLSLWQLDAHAYWKSSGDRFLSFDELSNKDMKLIYNRWKDYNKKNIYSFEEHLRACKDLDEAGRLSKLFMTLPPVSGNDMVWTDINRLNTLNTNQVNRKKEKHVCPLSLDIIERLINRFTNEGDLIDDPFGGLFSTAYVAMKMKRKAISVELNPDYYDDGLFYLKSLEYKLSIPTLFDFIENES